MNKLIQLLIVLLFLTTEINGQMVIGNDTLYGDEWISYQQSYFKIPVTENGIYKITKELLTSSGLPISDIGGDQFQLYAYGKEVPIYTSSNNIFEEDDYILFYGESNLGYMDQFLYEDWSSQQLNPEYSLFTDTMHYFLSWSQNTNNIRYTPISNEINNPPTPEPYYIASQKTVLNNSYIKATYNGTSNITFSSFDVTEGFGSSQKNNHNYNIAINHIAPVDIDASLKIRTGSNLNTHITQYTFNDELIFTSDYSGRHIKEFDLDIYKDLMTDNNTLNIKESNGADRVSVAYYEIKYPRLFEADDLSTFQFELDQHNTKKYFEINNLDQTSGNFMLLDVVNHQILFSEFQENKAKFILDPSVKNRNLILANNTTGIIDIDRLTSVTFEDYSNLNPDYLILTSKKLNQEFNGQNPIQAYAEYRSSVKGGGYEVSIINAEDLYDQFGYGIPRHSLSIKNFANDHIRKWPNWKQTFIIGKGLNHFEMRKSTQLAENESVYFVPTYGRNGSDNLLFSGLNKNHPQVAVGRLAAINADHINNYLDKVKSQENHLELPQTIEGKLWSKNILHLGGGEGATQQNNFKNALNELKEIVETNTYGASVKSFFKTSSDIVQSASSTELIDYINNGVAMISFLGHSSVGTFDFNIEQVEAYNNKDKYPILLSMGCYSGNIHIPNSGLSGDFVLKKDKGVIAFIASVGTAYSNNLTSFSRLFYQKLGDDMINQPIGLIWKEIYESFQYNSATSIKTLIQQNTIHGDPAIKMTIAQGPDYTIDYKSFHINPNIISTADNELEINFDVVNLGRGITDSITIHIQRVLDDNIVMNDSILKISAPYNRQEVSVSLAIDGDKTNIGENKILITLDESNSIQEFPILSGELNNSLTDQQGNQGYPFYIVDNNIKTLYPEEFGIVNEDINLYASVTNLFVDEQTYIIQIDTSIAFQTPIDQATIQQQGGLLSWQPSFNPENERVYYWRASPDSLSSDLGYLWNYSSFLYSDTLSDGWNQSHVHQWNKNTLEDVVIDNIGHLHFNDNYIPYQVINQHREIGKNPRILLNNAIIEYNKGVDIKSGLFVFVSDTLFANPIVNIAGSEHGSDNNNSADRNAFLFDTETIEDRIEFINFMENEIPNGYNVILMNIQSETDTSNASSWEDDLAILGKTIFSVLEDQGATKVRTLRLSPRLPYIFAFRKNKALIDEVIAESATDILDRTINCTAKWYKGTMESPLIGPVKRWNSLSWNESLEASDKSKVELLLYNEQQQFISNFPIPLLDNPIDLSSINPDEHPYVQLRYIIEDSIQHTAPSLNQWYIAYEGLSDIAINSATFLDFHADTLSIGDPMKLDMMINLIGPAIEDSIEVEYSIVDYQNNTFIEHQLIPPFGIDKQQRIKYSYETKNINKDFNFSVKINKDNSPKELNHDNNVLLKKIVVLKDDINPILDVRFDGIKISNGELVSPIPLITVQLRDENKHLLLDNIDHYELILEDPNNNKTIVDLNGSNIQFTPGNLQDNTSIIEYRPQFLLEGNYKLEVIAKDASGNNSGDYNFKIEFIVIIEESISNVLNYPNPFSTSTQFVFDLGGETLPEQLSIEIYSITGKIVKTITSAEIGLIKLGRNRTEYKWNGTDDYGEKLGNGIYLYRVITDNYGNSYKHIETDVDQYFKKGWGKLSIIR